MKILIIGINGFIGSNLAEYFLKKKHTIMGNVHNIYNLWRIENILPSLEIINCKINNIKTFNSQIKEFNPDIVIHGGWYGSNSNLMLNDPKQFSENLPGLIDLFDVLKEINLKYFIGIGAGWEYGKYDKKAVESQTPTPINAYGSSKYIAYQLSNDLCKLYNIPFLWIRPFWLFGPKDYEKRFISCVINKCLNNEDMDLVPCNHVTNYLFIDDFLEGIDILINGNHKGIFNFSGSNYMDVKHIVDKIKELTNSKSKISYNKEYPEDFVFNLDGENNKLLNIGWVPKVNMDEGLEKTIKFHKI